MNRGLFPGWNRAASGVMYPSSRLALSGSLTLANELNAEFAGQILVDGGLPPYRVYLTGSPPLELSLSARLIDSARWAIVPSGFAATSGTYAFTVAVGSGDGQTATSDQSLTAVGGKIPSAVSGNTLWLDFSDPTYTFQDIACTTPVAANGDVINGAINKAGVGGNFITGGTFITWATSAQNGRAVMRCASASASYLAGSAISNYFTNAQATLIVVCKTSGITHSGTVSYNMYSIASDGGNYFGLHFTTATSARFNSYNWDSSGETKAQTVAPQDTWYVVLCQHIGGNIISSVNGGTKTSTASGNTSSLASTLKVGNNFSLVGALDIGEVVGFNSAISDSDLDAVITWLKGRWGIS